MGVIQQLEGEAVASTQIEEATPWRAFLAVEGLYILLLLAVFHETAWSMVSIWLRSDTFAHGFLIVPISVWLIWQRKSVLQKLVPRPAYRVLVVVAGSGFLWLLGNLVDALVVQQFALVALLISGTWAIMGHRVTWSIAFPLAFLLFAVPVGEELVPPLMEFTATFTVNLLQWSGIPVYREGLFFSLPSGDWSVVEACSGVRYLIASVTLGCLYAYLTYQSLSRRLIFIVISAIVPIIANGLRAYIIVMLGHLSDMKIATGVDHLIYGWLFFGLVMLLLFGIGSIWRESEPSASGPNLPVDPDQDHHASSRSSAASIGMVTLLLAICWPILAYSMNQPTTDRPVDALKAPLAGHWSKIEGGRPWDWEPIIEGEDQQLVQFYQQQGSPVALYTYQYLSQQQGNELINSQNLLVHEKDMRWRVIDRGQTSIRLGGDSITVDSINLTGPDHRLLVWSWYRVNKRYTSNPYIAKIYEALDSLSFSRRNGAKIMVAMPVEEGKAAPIEVLQDFVDVAIPELEVALDKVAEKRID